MSQDVSIWIDNYEDIFSDFDPRNFSERNISDDFLSEVKKVSRESDFAINELKLLIPEKNRNHETENIIGKRLHVYFRKNYQKFLEKMKSYKSKGYLNVCGGTAMMILASYISSLKSENFIMHIFLIILEPAGWFFVWAGLDNLFYYSSEQRPELDFYSKISKSKIIFHNI